MVKNKDLHQYERRRLLWERCSYLPNLKLHRAPNSMNAIAPKTAQMNEVRATYANTWAGLSPLSKRALSDRIITEWSENYVTQLFRKGYLTNIAAFQFLPDPGKRRHQDPTSSDFEMKPLLPTFGENLGSLLGYSCFLMDRNSLKLATPWTALCKAK